MNDENVNKDLKVRHLVTKNVVFFHTLRNFTEWLDPTLLLWIMFAFSLSSSLLVT